MRIVLAGKPLEDESAVVGVDLFPPKTDLRFREDCRETIGKPRGPVVTEPPTREDLGDFPIISIGDYVSRFLFSSGLRIDIAILDLRERRRPVKPPRGLLNGRRIIEVTNPSGMLTKESWSAVRESVEAVVSGEIVGILVEGEEDLLGFPAAILAPEGWWIAYGQPLQGMVLLRVSEGVKREAKLLLDRCFTPV